MQRKSVARVCAMIAAACLTQANGAEARFDELLSRVPGDANVLVLIDVTMVRSAALAQREHWFSAEAAASAHCPLVLPPTADRVALAARINTAEMEPLWEAALLSVSQDAPMDLIARAEGGRVDNVAGTPAAWTPDDAYVVQLAPRLVGLLAPADRQYTSRWIRSGPQTGALPAYLQKAAKYAGSAGIGILLAMDLEDSIGPHELREELALAKCLEGQKVDLDELIAVLGSMKGVTLRVRIGEKAHGQLRVDFGRDAAVLAELGKPLLIETLAEMGAAIDDLNAWKAQVKGKTLYLSGDLSPGGMWRLFSVIDPPSPKSGGAKKPEGQTGQTSAQTKAYASQRYFKAVNSLLDDLGEKRGERTYTQVALWMERYGRKIDRLPILNVDSDLLDYGAEVAERLRECADTVRGSVVQARAEEMKHHTSRRRHGHRRSRRYQSAQRRRVRAEQKQRGTTAAMAIIKKIEDATAAIRRTMTERYKVEF